MICLFSNAQDKKETKTESKNGLTTVTFNTPKGKVTVTLPEKTHAGDVISGTVIAEPKGKKEKQKAKNKNILNGYVVELEKKKPAKKDKKVKWKIPEKVTKKTTELVLKNEKGEVISKVLLPVNETARKSIVPGKINELDFKIPEYLRAGEPEMIPGVFDGDFENSTIKIDGIVTGIIAESPDGIFFETPENVVGEINIELIEQDFELSAKVNVIELNLSADKLKLAKGEMATIIIEISGLSGIETVVPFIIENLSPANILMEGGNEQQLIIALSDIDEKGCYRKSIKVEAFNAGGFSVMVEIIPFNKVSILSSPEK